MTLASDIQSTPPAVGAARWATMTFFLLSGVGLGSWFARIPQVQASLGLDEAALGLALLGAALGAVIAMPLGGWVTARIGSRRMTWWTAIAFGAALALPALATDALTLFAALLVLGAGIGTMDVAMNTQGVTIEQRRGRPVMSSLHGGFSVGGLLGAGSGGLVAAAGVTPLVHLTTAAVLVTAAAAVTGRWLLPGDAKGAGGGPGFARPTGSLLGLAGMAFVALLAEGAISDWSAVYLDGDRDAGPAVAAAGYAVFSTTMAIGRLTGDRLVARTGPRTVVGGGGLLAAVGLAGAVITTSPALALVGFALVGAGLSCLAPVLFAMAADVGDLPPSAAIAALTTTGYLGFLVGPPVIGFTAALVGLPAALGLVAALLIVVALAARATPALSSSRDHTPAPDAGTRA